MSTTVRGAATPAMTGLEIAATALTTAAAQLTRASKGLEAAEGPASNAQLLGEEIRDVLVRVKAEREKLHATLPTL